MATYNGLDYDAPAPIAQVTLRNAETREAVDGIILLIGTGADIALLPFAAVQKLNVPISAGNFALVGYGGTAEAAQVARIILEFENLTFKGEFGIIDMEFGILGRNLLNSMVITLNGPDLRWQRTRPSTV